MPDVPEQAPTSVRRTTVLRINTGGCPAPVFFPPTIYHIPSPGIQSTAIDGPGETFEISHNNRDFREVGMAETKYGSSIPFHRAATVNRLLSSCNRIE